jgi:ribosomal protein S18 acetylase RimI-like enzyme
LYYQSNWPEIGLSTALDEGALPPFQSPSGDAAGWVRETRFAGLAVRWVASRNAFESQLYGFPIWEFHVEAGDGSAVSSQPVFLALLQDHLCAEIDRLPGAVPWEPAYVFSKVVAGEPLHRALARSGFQEIEHRRLYKTPVRDMIDRHAGAGEGVFRFTTLEETTPTDRATWREQILEICREAFGAQGFSRHFTDPFLLERRAGLDYILAVMQMNFERLQPADFLVAVDDAAGRIAGFSVVGKKPGMAGASHTQLLSAVANDYRGRGIYQGLTQLLWRTLPRDAALLNVTHVGNRSMQRAYLQSARVHLADTVLMRRVFQ